MAFWKAHAPTQGDLQKHKEGVRINRVRPYEFMLSNTFISTTVRTKHSYEKIEIRTAWRGPDHFQIHNFDSSFLHHTQWIIFYFFCFFMVNRIIPEAASVT